MILLNIDEFDSSLEKIIDWLDLLKVNYYLINERQTLFDFKSIQISNDRLDLGLFNYENQTSFFYWNRRSFPIRYNHSSSNIKESEQKEQNALDTFVNRLLEDNAVNKFEDNFTNKLYNLFLAKRLGIRVPSTLITSKKAELFQFYIKHNKQIINKAIDTQSCFNHNYDGRYTNLITEENINNQDENFPPSLFQEYLPKKYEIRSFYFFGKFYSMAVFSQLDEQTKIDLRNYNYEKPNRCVPYELPKFIKTKLSNLMQSLSLKTGSFDLIYSESGIFYFLEVNPVGLFSPLTWPLNLPIEKDIAFYFKQYEKQREK